MQKITSLTDDRVFVADPEIFKKPIDTVVFDLDDLLYSFHTGVFQQMNGIVTDFYVEEFGISEKSAKKKQNDMYVKHGTNMRALIVEKLGGVRKLVDKMHNLTDKKKGLDISVIPQDPELAEQIKKMKEGGLRVLIFSNGQRDPYVSKILEHMGVDLKMIDGIYGSDETNYMYPKPYKEAFDNFCEEFKVNRKTSIYFEDSHKNFPKKDPFAITALRMYPREDGKHFYMFSEEARKTGVPSNAEVKKVMNDMPYVDVAGFEITAMIDKVVLRNFCQNNKVKAPLRVSDKKQEAKQTEFLEDEVWDYNYASLVKNPQASPALAYSASIPYGVPTAVASPSQTLPQIIANMFERTR